MISAAMSRKRSRRSAPLRRLRGTRPGSGSGEVRLVFASVAMVEVLKQDFAGSRKNKSLRQSWTALGICSNAARQVQPVAREQTSGHLQATGHALGQYSVK